MGIGVQLRRYSRDPLVIGVAKGVGRDARAHIDVFFAVCVKCYRTLTRDDLDGEAAVGLRDVFGIKFECVHFYTY